MNGHNKFSVDFRAHKIAGHMISPYKHIRSCLKLSFGKSKWHLGQPVYKFRRFFRLKYHIKHEIFHAVKMIGQRPGANDLSNDRNFIFILLFERRADFYKTGKFSPTEKIFRHLVFLRLFYRFFYH